MFKNLAEHEWKYCISNDALKKLELDDVSTRKVRKKGYDVSNERRAKVLSNFSSAGEY